MEKNFYNLGMGKAFLRKSKNSEAVLFFKGEEDQFTNNWKLQTSQKTTFVQALNKSETQFSKVCEQANQLAN